MSTHFAREIREQPAALARLLTAGRATVEAIAAEVRRFGPRFVVTVARGSSDNAARYGKYLFGAHNRLVVSLGAPSLLTRYQAPPSFDGALVVGISQSGESPDLVALVDEARRQGALTVTVTNAPTSALACAAHHVVDLNAGPEQAVVASKSYSCELLALAMLSAALEEPRRPERWRDLERIPDAVATTLSLLSNDVIEGAVAPLVERQQLLVLGRGFNFATAFEIALKMKETARLLADPYATPDLLHGPMAMIGAGFPALVVAPTGACHTDATGAADALVARGADVVMLSDVAPPSSVRGWLPLATDVPEWLSPLTAVIPGQLCALALAQARNLDPDQPRGLTKVTRTL